MTREGVRSDYEEDETIMSNDMGEYPRRRVASCPFTPGPEHEELRQRQPVTRVRLWNGSTPFWSPTYDMVRFVLGDNRFSADGTNPTMPRFVQFDMPAEILNFGRMDDPEHARLQCR